MQFLKTEDESWPLLFPMAKSVVRAMDALRPLPRTSGRPISSRSWFPGLEAWVDGLAHRAADKRVKAIAPLVIDMLNFGKQLPHQITFVRQAQRNDPDYTNRGLIPIPDTTPGKKLWSMVDPWMYRETMTMPKMIISARMTRTGPRRLEPLWDDLKGINGFCMCPTRGTGSINL